MFSIFDYNDGVFQLNIWDFVLVFLPIALLVITSLWVADKNFGKEK